MAGVAAIVGGAALFGVGLAMMNSAEPPSLLTREVSEPWWIGLMVSAAGVGLTVSGPVYLGIAAGLTRYGKGLQAKRARERF